MDGQQRSFQEILADLGENAAALYQRMDLRRELEEHPYRTLGIAAATGYILAGGLFTGFTRRTLGIGARVLLLPLAQATLGQFVSELEQDHYHGS